MAQGENLLDSYWSNPGTGAAELAWGRNSAGCGKESDLGYAVKELTDAWQMGCENGERVWTPQAERGNQEGQICRVFLVSHTEISRGH